MELFDREVRPKENLLPKDGEVNYYGKVFDRDESDRFYRILLEEIAWENDVAYMFGKRIVTKRKVGWYGDIPFEYKYSNNTKVALPWTPTLKTLKDKSESVTGETYNSCLLNLYHSGAEGMAYHSDDEPDLLENGAIASLSFGAERKFAFKHKETKETVNVWLEHGSILVMKGACQKNWVHRLPPTKKVHSPRVNLTFRTIVE